MLVEEYHKLTKSYGNCLIGGFFFLFILLVFFGMGTYMLTLQIKAESYVETQAVIVDYYFRYEESHRDNGHTVSVPTWYHVVEYESGGETYRKTCDTSTSEASATEDIGKPMTIFVNPKNPKDVVFRNSTHILLITVSYLVSAIGFVVIGCVFHKAYVIKQTLKQYK